MTFQHTALFAMPNSERLGSQISKKLNLPLTPIEKIKFADGEVILKSKDTIRNKNAFIIASSSPPVHENLMELLIFVDSLKRASAKSITVVLSYYGYGRQDRKSLGREPITARLIADLLEKSGVTKVIAIDLHNSSIQGFFSIPLDDLKGQYIFANFLKKRDPNKKFTVVSPDHGGAVRARILAELISQTIEIAIVDKRRINTNETEIIGLLGNVKNNNAIIIDDMIDTGGTIIQAAKLLKKEGAKRITIAATHGIFSKGFQKFEESSVIDEVLTTDTINSVHNIKSNKLTIVSVDTIIAQTIQATINSTSVGSIFGKMKKNIQKL